MRKMMTFVAGSVLALGGVAVAAPAQAHESRQDTGQSASVQYGKHHYKHKHSKSYKGYNKWHDHRNGWWYGSWWQNEEFQGWLTDWHQKWHQDNDGTPGTPGDGGTTTPGDGTVETPGGGGAVVPGGDGSAETPGEDTPVESS